MTWFNIVKGAKEDAEAYWIEFTDNIDGWFDKMIETLNGYLEELDKMNQKDENYQKLSDLEKEIVKPIMDMMSREINETRKQTLMQLKQIKLFQRESRKMMVDVKDAPIEIKIRQLLDSFNEMYDDVPKEFMPPRVDRKRVEDIIHRLGFEGKGLE